MKYIEDLKEMLCDELDKIASKGELTAGSLDTVQKLSHSLKSVLTIMAMEGYGDSYDDMSYDGDYERGNRSYARGRGGRNVRRDSMGRYSRENRGRSRRMYSGDEYDEVMEDPKVRQALQKALEKMED